MSHFQLSWPMAYLTCIWSKVHGPRSNKLHTPRSNKVHGPEPCQMALSIRSNNVQCHLHHLWRQVSLLQMLLRMFLVVGSHKHLGSSQGWHRYLWALAWECSLASWNWTHRKSRGVLWHLVWAGCHFFVVMVIPVLVVFELVLVSVNFLCWSKGTSIRPRTLSRMCTTRGQTSPGPLLASIRSGPAFSLRAAGPKHLYSQYVCSLLGGFVFHFSIFFPWWFGMLLTWAWKQFSLSNVHENWALRAWKLMLWWRWGSSCASCCWDMLEKSCLFRAFFWGNVPEAIWITWIFFVLRARLHWVDLSHSRALGAVRPQPTWWTSGKASVQNLALPIHAA